MQPVGEVDSGVLRTEELVSLKERKMGRPFRIVQAVSLVMQLSNESSAHKTSGRRNEMLWKGNADHKIISNNFFMHLPQDPPCAVHLPCMSYYATFL